MLSLAGREGAAGSIQKKHNGTPWQLVKNLVEICSVLSSGLGIE